jgi:hypothetical protein
MDRACFVCGNRNRSRESAREVHEMRCKRRGSFSWARQAHHFLSLIHPSGLPSAFAAGAPPCTPRFPGDIFSFPLRVELGTAMQRPMGGRRGSVAANGRGQAYMQAVAVVDSSVLPGARQGLRGSVVRVSTLVV